MNGYQRRTERKREAILDAAQALFFARGVTDVHVAEIATEAHVSQVTIYHYFGDKQRLAREVVKRYMNRIMNEIENLLLLDLPFIEKLKRFADTYITHTNRLTDTYLSSVSWDDQEIQAAYQAYVIERSIPLFRTFVEQGKHEGVIPKNLSFEAITTYLEQFRHLFSQLDYLKTEKKYKEDLAHLFFYGLLGKQTVADSSPFP